jgi:hypothetical protein
MIVNVPDPNVPRIGLIDIGITVLRKGTGTGPIVGAVDHYTYTGPTGQTVYAENALLVVPGPLGQATPLGFKPWPANSGAFGWPGATRVKFIHNTHGTILTAYQNANRPYSLRDFLKRGGNPASNTTVNLWVVERQTSWTEDSGPPTPHLLGYAAAYERPNGTLLDSHGFWQNKRGSSGSAYTSFAFAWAKPSLSPANSPLAGARYREPDDDVGLQNWTKKAPSGAQWLSGSVSATARYAI